MYRNPLFLQRTIARTEVIDVADETNNSGMGAGDILSSLLGRQNSANSEADTLKNIENLLKQLVGNSRNMSGANARFRGYSSDTKRYFSNNTANAEINAMAKSFANSFTDSLFGKGSAKAFFDYMDKELKNSREQSINDAKSFGDDIGQSLAKTLSESKFGGVFTELKDLLSNAQKPGGAFNPNSQMPDIFDDLDSSAQNASNVFNRMRRNANDASSSMQDFTSRMGDISPLFESSASIFNTQQSMVGSLNSIARWVTGDSLNNFTSAINNSTQKFQDALYAGNSPKGKKSGGLGGLLNRLVTVGNVQRAGQAATAASNVLANATGMLGKVGSVLGTVGSVLGNPVSIAGASVPVAQLAVLGFKFQNFVTGIIRKVIKTIGIYTLTPAIQGFISALDAATSATFRYTTSQKENIKSAKTRIEADVKTMVEAPFKILEQAAEEWYQAWDNNLKVITATQGYDKADVQALAAAFSERLKAEGLSSVISSADILSNLKTVLQTGLSGAAAEEFAYVATVLGETIPTQNFFSYADEYSSIIANAINAGMSQESAIKEATAQITAFANNLLAASRATGGLTTGLKDAETLFRQSVQIAQTSGTNNARSISGLLTTVAATTGALAPDLASSITEAVYNAAVGGNNTSAYVALRSLAGVNASNTEFLRQLSKDPQRIFSTLFTNLAEMQNMSNDAFMEVAEGLADVFGVSMSALARIDFNTLADAIKNFNNSSDALDENLELLRSGQTTTTAEQLKMAEINKIILDEGLSYVLDNETARAIQQHMWDEQIAREIQESTYAVDVQGAMLDLVEGISLTLTRIQKLVTGSFLSDAVNDLTRTYKEAVAQRSDIADMLALGKVGGGNKNKLYQLTTYGRDFNLVNELVDMMGGVSAYGLQRDAGRVRYQKMDIGSYYRDFENSWLNSSLLSNWAKSTSIGGDLFSSATGVFGLLTALDDNNWRSGSAMTSFKSKYNTWGTIGKSAAESIADATSQAIASSDGISKVISDASATAAAQAKADQNLNRMLESMEDFAKTGKSYESFVATAKEYGISNFEDALENSGYTPNQIQDHYENLQAQIAAMNQEDRKKKEESFWTDSTTFLSNISDYTLKIHDAFSQFMSEWEDYFIKHSVYNNAYTRESVDRIMRTERENSESAIYALADALTENNVDLLVDPTLQTNALLSQILKVANAILNQQSTGGGSGVSLPDTIAGLSLGIINM